MSGEIHPRSREILDGALALPPYARERFVFEQCGDDWVLYNNLLELIASERHRRTSPADSANPAAPEPPHDESNSLSAGTGLDTADGRYQILDVLGEGGMGIVYLADQVSPIRRRLALKIMKIGGDAERAKMRFESERRALALMNHPSIARVYEAGQTSDGRLFLAMEYVAGLPITEYCDRAGMGIADRLTLFIDVCRAIGHAHRNGIIHRDIKPSNVLVSRSGNEHVCKIIDFGVAISVDRGDAGQAFSPDTPNIVGSIKYMSPEQLRPQAEGVDTRSDIYSLGVLLYELVTGLHPLPVHAENRQTLAEIEHRLNEVEPLLPSAHVGEQGREADQLARQRGMDGSTLERTLRGDLDWIVAKSLEKDPDRRYPSASEFVADIERYRSGEPALAGPLSARRRIYKLIARNKALVISATAVLLALVVGVSSSTYQLLKNRKATEVARQQSEQILQLADANVLENCLEEAGQLVPPHPEKIAEMEAWLAGDARALADRLSAHRNTLDDLTAEGPADRIVISSSSAPVVHFGDPEKQFHYDLLHDLVDKLEAFADPDPHIGTIADVEQRLEFAQTVVQRSIDAYAETWERAVASIANPDECPLYQGLHIVPQVGLVPVGRNPTTGLWEFAHLATGEVRTVPRDNRIVVREEMSVILVLIPGGQFWMGATQEKLSDPGIDSGNRYALARERPLHLVELDPFFISKYEITQAQWQRLTGQTPSAFPAGETRKGETFTPLHPVEQVCWFEADAMMRRVGLELPTEAQWEYAARAGTATPWWFGDEASNLSRTDNTSDLTALDAGRPKTWVYGQWRDGFVFTSPVGSFVANPFGLYDVYGNVEEWCRDPFADYLTAVAPGDGFRLAADTKSRVTRGGLITGPAYRGRSAWRHSYNPADKDLIGIRPTRPVQFLSSARVEQR